MHTCISNHSPWCRRKAYSHRSNIVRYFIFAMQSRAKMFALQIVSSTSLAILRHMNCNFIMWDVGLVEGGGRLLKNGGMWEVCPTNRWDIGVEIPVTPCLLCGVPDIRWVILSESTASCYQHRLINTTFLSSVNTCPSKANVYL